MFFDFAKAFDSVPHNELLYKLWLSGITGPLWLFFKDCLQHFVEVEGCKSDLLPVKSGVPQGSVLGPLLFLIYVDDIPSLCSFSSVFLFADDAKLIASLNSASENLALQKDLDNLLSWWCQSWKLSLNTSKCAYMNVSLSSSTNNNNTIDDTIKTVTQQKDLGILLSDSLSWSVNIKQICSKAYRSLYLIRQTIPCTSPINIKKSLYLSLVRSQLTYCSQLWFPNKIQNIILLERVQRRATKYILNNYNISYKLRLIHLNILPLMYYLQLLDLLFLVKCLKNPSDSFNVFNHVTFHSGSTRSSSNRKLEIKFQRTSTT